MLTTFTHPIESKAVQDFFDRKARAWPSKYAVNGPLVHRLELFRSQLELLMPPPARVIELGCGSGNLASYLASCGYQLVACDIAEKMLAEARRAFPQTGIEWRQVARGGTLPVADGSCDALVASSVFEYVDDLPHVFAECHRVLRPGGMLLISVPTPGNKHRMLEAVLRPVASRLRVVPLRWPAKLEGYFEYLHLSKNRFSLARWNSLAAQAGLASVSKPDTGTGALTLLSFRRDT